MEPDFVRIAESLEAGADAERLAERAVSRQIGEPQAIVLPPSCPLSAFVCRILLPAGCSPPPGRIGFRIGCGVALTASEARRFCLFEGIERYSLQVQAGDPARLASLKIGSSAETLRDASAVLLGHPQRDAFLPPIDSRGCAAGSSIADAAKRALLEWIEFDAIERWQGGTAGFRTFIPSHRQIEKIADWLATLGKCQRFLRWRDPTGVAVVVVLTCDFDGRHPALGSAARFDIQSAIGHASLESAFATLNLEQIDRANHDDENLSVADRETLAIYRGKTELPPGAAADDREVPSSPEGAAFERSGDDLATLARLLEAFARPVAFFDLTRKETGVAVVRATVLTQGI
jgi:ribosomal protein S12 methylthiotransferase accessory factor YcaO